MKKKELSKIFKEIKRKNIFSDEKIQTFTDILKKFLNNISVHRNHEESLKQDLNDFLKNFYPNNYIGVKPISIPGISARDIDLAIFDSPEKIENDKVRVIFETKPQNHPDMINENDFNRKSMHETILYYLIEKMEFKNNFIESIIITDYLNWFIISSEDYKNTFFKNKQIMQIYNEYRNKKGDRTVNSTPYFYSECKKLLDNTPSTLDNLSYVHIDLSGADDIFKGNAKKECNGGLTIQEFLRLFSYISSQPFLFREPITYRNANQLNKTFYNILLSIIGVEEREEENKLKIVLDKTNKDSLIQKIIEKIYTKRIISSKEKEQEVFEHALGICLVWINRLLFIKLLEAYLLKINCPTKDLEEYYIISKNKIQNFKNLYNLFFNILAKEKHDVDIFKHVPYLNSSLFELSDLEKTYSITIDDFQDYPVKDKKMLEVYSKLNNKKIAQENFVNLIIDFLNYYDFGSEKESRKTDNLINASVLGLIFEKINGYKEGSYYTPSQVTEFISKETISRAVLDKINLYLKKHSKLEQNSLDSLKNLIARNKDDNDLLLGISDALYDIKICDPAVGSGHFLVSALNDLLRIRCDLGLTFSKEKNYVKLCCEYDDFREIRFYKDYECKKEIKYTRDNSSFNYQEEQETIFYIKKRIIESSLYGVDINPNSIEICRLRLWIELLKNVYYKDGKMETLPNIDINIKHGDSLINYIPLESRMKDLACLYSDVKEYKKLVSKYKEEQDKSLKNEITKKIKQITDKLERSMIDKSIERWNKQIKRLKDEISQQTLNFNAGLFTKNKVNKEAKEKIKKNQEKIVESGKKKEIFVNSFEWAIEFPDLLDKDCNFVGFDVMILNPPYIGTKEAKQIYSKEQINWLNKYYLNEKSNVYTCKFRDLYELFYYRVFRLLNKGGYTGVITSDTFLTTGSFKNFRNFLLKKQILVWLPCPANTFKNEGGGPTVSPSIFIFKSIENDINLEFKCYERFRDIRKLDVDTLESYKGLSSYFLHKGNIRNSFFIPNLINIEIFEKLIKRDVKDEPKEKNLAYLQKISEGAQGLATANNSKFLGSNDKKIIETARYSILKNYSQLDRFNIKLLLTKEYQKYYDDYTSNDNIKHSLIWRFVEEDKIQLVKELKQEELTEGISSKKCWLPYTKGDREGTKWCSKTPYLIEWSLENVKYFKRNSPPRGNKKTRWQGYKYFLKKGITWTLVSNINATVKARILEPSIFDVNAMIIIINNPLYSNEYLLGLLNSKLFNRLIKNFYSWNNAIQIGDLRLCPILAPQKDQRVYIEELVEKCIQIKKNNLSEIKFKNRVYTLNELEKKIEDKVLDLYDINKGLFKEEIEEDLSEEE